MTHVITGIEQETVGDLDNPQSVTQFRWICSCDERGKWNTLERAEANGKQHMKSGMSRHAASNRCRQLWYRFGLPFTRLRPKRVVDRCEVGYLADGRVHVMGAGPTWEIAFERAEKGGAE